MPPPARLGREVFPQEQHQSQPPAAIQKTIEKAMAQKDAVLERSSGENSSFLQGLKALSDDTPTTDKSGRGESHPAVAKGKKEVSQRADNRTAEEITKAPEQGVAKELTGDPLEQLEQLSDTSTEEAEAATEKAEEVKSEETTSTESDGQSAEDRKKYKWGELKAKAEKLDVELPKLEARIKEFEQKEKAFAEKEKQLEELTTKYEEAQTKIAAVDILEDPDYQENVAKPFEERMSFLKEAAKEYSLSWPSLLQVMEQPNQIQRNKALAALIGESETTVDAVTQADMSRAISELTVIRQHGEALEKDAKKSLEAMKLSREAKQAEDKEKTMAQRKDTAAAVFRRMQKTISELADEPVDTWVKDYALADHDPSIQIAQTYALAALPKIISSNKKALAEKDAKIAQLEATLKARSNGSPRMEATNGSSQSTQAEDSRPFGERLASYR